MGGRPSFGAKRPNCSVPVLHPVKGVLGYREAIQRQFPRSVAVSTHHWQAGSDRGADHQAGTNQVVKCDALEADLTDTLAPV